MIHSTYTCLSCGDPLPRGRGGHCNACVEWNDPSPSEPSPDLEDNDDGRPNLPNIGGGRLTDEDRRRDLTVRWHTFLQMIYAQADASAESYSSKL